MTTDSKNLIEEIIDNAIDPSTHLNKEDADPAVPDSIDPDIIKRTHNDHRLHKDDPLNENLVPDPDKVSDA
ncbi:MAG: hypothetical protein ACTS9Y_05190 [Methylophilus sp.]|uniref:hypothetical protein n=1 Tax=Methylophilus sp. TaxID=29541 RepID=UPI003FA0B369